MTPTSLSIQPLSQTLTDLTPALKNHLWQSTIFLLAAALLTLVLRHNHARTRYALWLAASIKFLIPFSFLIALGTHFAKPHTTPPTQIAVYDAMEEVSQPFTITLAPTPLPATTSTPPPTHLLPIAIATIWLTGFLTVLSIWFLYWRRITTILREATPLHEGRKYDILRRLEATANLRTPIELLASPTTLGPGIYGIARPRLIWPAGISQRLDDAHLESVLAHEICHVRRRDNLTATLHMLVEAIFWFHPLVWWLGARLETERERACDESVLESSSALAARPHIYAESILKICEFYVESPLPCVSGVTGADLKQRLRNILDRRATLKLSLAKIALLTAAGFIALAVPILSGQAKAAQRAVEEAVSPILTQNKLLSFASPQAPASDLPAESDANNTGEEEKIGPPFEVATVRGAQDGAPFGLKVTASGRVTVNSASVLSLVVLAYVEKHGSANVVAGPKWDDSEYYDINAKIDEANMAGWEKLSDTERLHRVMPMLRALLAERFHLKLATEMRSTPVYALVQAKGGAKLREVPPPSPEDSKFVRSGYTWTGFAVPIGNLVGMIQGVSGADRLVVDETGLKGFYDFTFQVPNGKDGATAPELIESGLGLKLEPRKALVKTYVIESADKPSLDGAELPVESAPPNTAHPAAATSTASAPYVPTMTFDLASVRQSPEANSYMVSGWFTDKTTTFRATNWSIDNLVSAAYGGLDFYQIDETGIPQDLRRAMFMVQAKGDDAAEDTFTRLTQKQQRLEQAHMVLALLEDRFKLKAHFETRQGSVYNLVAPKGEAKLRNATRLPPTQQQEKAWGDRTPPPLYQTGDSRIEFDYIAHDCQMSDLVEMLAGQFGHPVIDKTGFTGKYNFTLKTHETKDSDRKDDDLNPIPTLETAIQDQLGLKLEPAKGPTQVLVIDHIEKPSEN